MRVISIGSSSSGNSYIIEASGRVMVLDAGLSCRKITQALEAAGYDAGDVYAILITHEHTDHIKSIRTLARKCPGAFVYASRGTIASCEALSDLDEYRLRIVKGGDEAACDEIRIRAFSLSHDAAEPVGYSISSGGEKLSVVTDTGIITDEIYSEIADSTMIVLEANHDEHLLMYGAYPYPVKRRIKGDFGHLSNRAAGELLAELLRERAETYEGAVPKEPLPVMLAHLSFHNNMPFKALETVESILEEAGFAADADYALTVASKDEITIFGR